MQNQLVSQQPGSTTRESVRLHYVDWLRVLAILGVFLYHAVHPFDLTGWHIKNNDLSLELTIIIVLFGLWGMPLFFLLAGAGSWFALRRRSAQQYTEERFKRLLIPFIFGSILFMPVMLYFEWVHNTEKGLLQTSFLEFVIDRNVGFSPRWFASLGYHLWFLGFLFSFSILGLPIFRWLKGESGKRVISRLARLSEKHGGIMIFILPLSLVQLILRPFFPIEHDWGDFFFQFTFFVLGYVLFADGRFIQSIRRDWLLLCITAIAATVALVVLYVIGDPFTWSETPDIPEYYLVWSIITVDAWCWVIFVLFIGMRFLDFSNNWLQYSKVAVLPFYLVHQPVIIVIAFFVVQWNASILIKLPVVVLGSFVVSIALYELIIRRIGPLQPFFGIITKKNR